MIGGGAFARKKCQSLGLALFDADTDEMKLIIREELHCAVLFNDQTGVTRGDVSYSRSDGVAGPCHEVCGDFRNPDDIVCSDLMLNFGLKKAIDAVVSNDFDLLKLPGGRGDYRVAGSESVFQKRREAISIAIVGGYSNEWDGITFAGTSFDGNTPAPVRGVGVIGVVLRFDQDEAVTFSILRFPAKQAVRCHSGSP